MQGDIVMSYSGYFIVRDENGNPKFDDWNNIHEAYWVQLTEADKNFILTKRSK